MLLQPFRRTLTRALVNSPKLDWVDLGLQRHVTRQWSELTGEQFETLVGGEIHKLCSTMARDVASSFYRTRSGLEVDLMLESSAGLLGVEIKNRVHAVRRDWNALRSVGSELGPEWLGGLVAYRGDRVERLDEELGIRAVPIHRLV